MKSEKMVEVINHPRDNCPPLSSAAQYTVPLKIAHFPHNFAADRGLKGIVGARHQKVVSLHSDLVLTITCLRNILDPPTCVVIALLVNFQKSHLNTTACIHLYLEIQGYWWTYPRFLPAVHST